MNPKRNDHSKNETDEASVVSSWRRKISASKIDMETAMTYDDRHLQKCPEPLVS